MNINSSDEHDGIKVLEYLDQQYYNAGNTIEDSVYDEFKEILKKEYPDNSYFKNVGATISGEKVKLPFVLGSLDRVKEENIEKWFNKYDGPWVVSEKLDGVSIMVQYNYGEVVFAATRGDGEYGKDITEKVKIFCPKIEYKSLLVLRGEAMLIDSTLGFKNRRNGASGIINRDDNTNSDKIVPYFYEIIQGNLIDIGKTESSRNMFLMKYFSSNIPFMLLMSYYNIQQLKDFYIESKSKIYDTDGLVITVDNYVRENVKYPKKKIKFKMPGEKVETTVIDIEWNVSRTKRIIPVILIDPVNISGSTISRTTGWNAKFILDNKLSKDRKVYIEKAGDVIPYITIMEHSNDTNFSIIDKCPSCGKSLSWKGVDLICSNETCNNSEYKIVEHFLTTMGTENITVKTLEKLGTNTIESLYDLDEFSISSIDGFGIKKARLIIKEINKILKNVRPEKLIKSFGISGIGNTVSKAVVDSLGDIKSEEIMKTIMSLTTEDLENIDGIGEIIANNFVENIGKYQNLIEFLVNRGMTYAGGTSKLKGKVFTLTGKDSSGIGRNILTEMIVDKGGSVKGISKKSNFLVTDDPDSQSGKAKKAREYGTSIIDYSELKKILEEV